MEFTSELVEYLHKDTKRPNKYLIELMAVNNVGGFENMYKIIEYANIPNRLKISGKKKIIRLENIYQNYLKAKA
jgi:hypothetical protein